MEVRAMAYLVRTSGQEQQLARGGATRRRLRVSSSFWALVMLGWFLAVSLPLLLGTGALSKWMTALLASLGAV